MTINVKQLATQIYIQTVAHCIGDRTIRRPDLDGLFRSAAESSIAAAEEFARCYEKQATLPAVPVA